MVFEHHLYLISVIKIFLKENLCSLVIIPFFMLNSGENRNL